MLTAAPAHGTASGYRGATCVGLSGSSTDRTATTFPSAIWRATRPIERFVRAPAASAELDALTGREREVLVLLGRGRSNAEIAADLLLSEATVETHVTRVLRKLDLRNRAQAVVFAYESGLVTPGAAAP